MHSGLKMLEKHIFMMRLSGIWPSDRHSYLYTIYTNFVYVAFFVGFNLSIWLHLLRVQSVDDLSRILMPAFYYMVATVKLLIMRFNRLRIIKLLKLLNTIEKYNWSPSECLKIDRGIYIGKCLFFFIHCSSGIVFLASFTIVLINKQKILIWPSINLIDWDSQSFVYYLILFLQLFGTIYYGIAIVHQKYLHQKCLHYYQFTWIYLDPD